MQIKWDIEGLKNLEAMRETIPAKARSVLKQAGHLFIEELDYAAGSLLRAERHGFVKRNDMRHLAGSFSLRSTMYDTLQITTPIPWASIIDEGGDIVHPRMTVPFPGVSISNEDLASLRASGKTFAKKDIIFLKSGGEGSEETEPIFKLKGKVHIKATYYSTKAQLKATPRIVKLFSKAIDEASK